MSVCSTVSFHNIEYRVMNDLIQRSVTGEAAVMAVVRLSVVYINSVPCILPTTCRMPRACWKCCFSMSLLLK